MEKEPGQNVKDSANNERREEEAKEAEKKKTANQIGRLLMRIAQRLIRNFFLLILDNDECTANESARMAIFRVQFPDSVPNHTFVRSSVAAQTLEAQTNAASTRN